MTSARSLDCRGYAQIDRFDNTQTRAMRPPTNRHRVRDEKEVLTPVPGSLPSATGALQLQINITNVARRKL
jgi:hypothetical protein